MAATSYKLQVRQALPVLVAYGLKLGGFSANRA
jgi:hypothetical protein